MKTEIWEEENFFSIVRINFILLLIFIWLNNLDYFSTILSIWVWWIEINPVIRFMLDIPLLLFVWKIFILSWFVWWIVYKSDSKRVMWSMIVVNLIYLLGVWGNFGVTF